jgi:hypothetical protein
MREIEIDEDVSVFYKEICDGEAICIGEEEDGEVLCEIILIRPIALQLAKKIYEILGYDDEKAEE